MSSPLQTTSDFPYIDDETARLLIEPGGFADPRAAARCVRELAALPGARLPLSRIWPQLLKALTNAASPDRALVNFARFIQGTAEPLRLLETLAEAPRTTEMLVTLFAGSQFLTEILLRNSDYLPRLADRAALTQIKSADRYAAEARLAVAAAQSAKTDSRDATAFEALRRFQRQEFLRIGISDLCALLDLPSVTQQLSYLADGIVRTALELVAPPSDHGPSGFAVLAMGKLGGGELNYSSDIDLLFLAGEDASAYQRLGERLITVLTQATGEGFLYRVDMRLRPWGAVGPLVTTTEGYLKYLKANARLWEKQALLRARSIAGDALVSRAFLAQASELLFTTNSEAVRADVHAMKQRTEARLRELGQDWGEVKLGEGSIRDVEFVVQFLQLTHGAEHPELRGGTVLEVLDRLAERRLVTEDEHRVLAAGYVFLRTVEHYLQILDYRQTHLLPANAADLRYLAQRLGYGGPDASARFVTRYQQHSAAVRAVYRRYLASPQPPPGGSAMTTNVGQPTAPPNGAASDPVEAQFRQHLARMSPSYAETFSDREIRRHADLASRLSEGNPVEVRAEASEDGSWRVTVVAYDYLGELSAICGLLFSHGFSIVDGQVFTYEPETAGTGPATGAEQPIFQRPPSTTLHTGSGSRRKIVDVFTVRSTQASPSGEPTEEDKGLWLSYAANLAALLRMLQSRLGQEAQGELARRIAVALPEAAHATPTLQPVDIEIDNDTSERYTILRIDAPDTAGFLYEFTNALALNGVYIAQVSVASSGNRAHDVLYVTDTQGRKITDPTKQRELRAATVLVKHFTSLLPHSPNPEAALQHFNEYLGELFRRPSWPDELASLERPEVLHALARLLGVSEFLWDDFLRMQYANLFPVVQDVGALSEPKSQPQLASELAASLDAVAGGSAETQGQARRELLNAFKDREMFRIDMRHILGRITDFGQFSRELTDLAEAVVGGAVQLVLGELHAQFGEPQAEDGRRVPLAVCVLGKCGGYELGYASDIELMFVYGGAGQTAGPRQISAVEFYEKVVMEFNRAIWARREGIFQIDLDLRPYGSAGSLAVSLDAFRRYFAPGGPAWGYERQALIKLRAIAGDAALGREVEALRDALVYSGGAFDVAAMRAMRERQLRHLVTPGTINAKYSPGALVDVEYTVQGLQMIHGQAHPQIHLTNTRAAIAAMAEADIISAENAARLTEALLFLRMLINALRVVRGNSKDLTVPAEDSPEFAFLARRLGYGNEPTRLRADLTHHLEWVRRLNTRLLG
jgi:glutamate-ammonia-ligase adenylyltransferase